MAGTWRVKTYMEFDIEADNEDEAIQRCTDVMLYELGVDMEAINNICDVREIAEVAAVKISDEGIPE